MIKTQLALAGGPKAALARPQRPLWAEQSGRKPICCGRSDQWRPQSGTSIARSRLSDTFANVVTRNCTTLLGPERHCVLARRSPVAAAARR